MYTVVQSCSPATIYVVIAVILTAIFLVINLFRSPFINLGDIILWLCIQIISIFVCFLIILGLCSFNETFAWVAVIIIAISALSTFVSILNTNTQYIVTQQ